MDFHDYTGDSLFFITGDFTEIQNSKWPTRRLMTSFPSDGSFHAGMGVTVD